MRFEHRDGEDAAGAISLGPVRDTVSVEDGMFDVDDDREDFEDVRDRLEAAGHTPLEDAPRDEAIKDADDESDRQEEEEATPPKASEFDESQLVEDLDYNEKQAIAAQYDHISGNASEEKITEELIKQRREEVDD